MTNETLLLICLASAIVILVALFLWLERKADIKKMEDDLKEDVEYRKARRAKVEAHNSMIYAEHLIREQQNKWREMNEERKRRKDGKR